MRLQYIGPFAKTSGLGRAYHDYAMALLQAGVELQIEPLVDCDTDLLEPRYQPLLAHLRRGEATDRKWPTHVMVHSIPHYAHEWVSGACAYPLETQRILMTAWESDRIEPHEVELINQYFDLTIVPSHHNLHSFRDSGVRHVVRVPHCYDPTWWRAPKGGPDTTAHLFYSINVWNPRKNLEALIRAYCMAFTAKDRVLLVLVCPNPDADAIRAIRGAHQNPPAVEVMQRVDESQLLRLHHCSHTYVSLSRGEGWGLGAFEAAIVGNRVIATNWGGHRDFLHGYSRYAGVNYRLVNLAPTPAQEALGHAKEQHWTEPDCDHAAQLLKQAYRTGRGTREPAPFAEKYSYEVVGRQLLEALNGRNY